MSNSPECLCGRPKCRNQKTIRCGTTEELFESDQYHTHYRLNGKLIGIGIDLVTTVGIYSRAFYYDLNYQHLSLGNYSALIECFIVRKLNLRYFTLGEYVHR